MVGYPSYPYIPNIPFAPGISGHNSEFLHEVLPVCAFAPYLRSTRLTIAFLRLTLLVLTSARNGGVLDTM